MFAILLEKISLHHSIIFFQYMIFFQYVEVNFSSINQLTDPLLFFFYSLITWNRNKIYNIQCTIHKQIYIQFKIMNKLAIKEYDKK